MESVYALAQKIITTYKAKVEDDLVELTDRIKKHFENNIRHYLILSAPILVGHDFSGLLRLLFSEVWIEMNRDLVTYFLMEFNWEELPERFQRRILDVNFEWFVSKRKASTSQSDKYKTSKYAQIIHDSTNTKFCSCRPG